MKINSNIKKLIMYFGFVFMIILSVPTYACENTGKESIETRADKYRWVYTTIDGVQYKRLYNETTGEWASGWIIA